MTIGIDFDNTIVDTKATSKKYLDIFMPGNNLDSYHDLEYDDALEFSKKYFIEITNNLNLFPYVKESFEYFKENNIKTVLITARGYDYEYLIEPTKRFLERNNIIFDVLEFNCPKKLEACKRNNVDIMIDDTLGVLENVKSEGVKGILYGKNDPNFISVNNWKEVLDYIKGGLK